MNPVKTFLKKSIIFQSWQSGQHDLWKSHASAHDMTRLHSVRQSEQTPQLSNHTSAYDTTYEVALNGLTRLKRAGVEKNFWSNSFLKIWLKRLK
jgi:hypothetical protein